MYHHQNPFNLQETDQSTFHLLLLLLLLPSYCCWKEGNRNSFVLGKDLPHHPRYFPNGNKRGGSTVPPCPKKRQADSYGVDDRDTYIVNCLLPSLQLLLRLLVLFSIHPPCTRRLEKVSREEGREVQKRPTCVPPSPPACLWWTAGGQGCARSGDSM